MKFEEFKKKIQAMAPGKSCTARLDAFTSSFGKECDTVRAYIEDIGWTGDHESYEAALVELDAKVKGFDAPKIAEGGYPELAKKGE